jgi:hypothetical protein
MADITVQDSYGKAVVKQAYIYSGQDKTPVNVADNIKTINIYEDIYSPFVYCDIMIIDTDNLASKWPLSGEEFFVLSYQSVGGKMVNYHFLLYKNDTGGINPSASMKGYMLHGVTLERAFDSGKTIDSTYTGTYASIAGQIFDDYVKSSTGGLEFNFEPSKSVYTYTPSQLTPLQAIEYCRRRALSTSAAKSPFVFFRNSDGYMFISMNGLFNKSAADPLASITHRIAGRSFSPENDPSTASDVVDIVDFDVVSYYDTMAKIDGGAFNTHTYAFDLTTKNFGLRKKFNLADSVGNFQLGGVNSGYNRKDFYGAFANTRCVAHYVPTNIGREVDGTATTDYIADHTGEMAAYLNLVSEYNIQYTMYGNSNITAGQVMKIAIPSAKDTAKSGNVHKNDKMMSGNFLICRTKHTLDFNDNIDYYIRVSAINGSRGETIEELNNE